MSYLNALFRAQSARVRGGSWLEGVSLVRRHALVLSVRGLNCLFDLLLTTPERCYAKGRKKGQIVQVDLDLEPRRTHAKARDYLYVHAFARVRSFPLFYYASAHARHWLRLFSNRIKHMYADYFCLGSEDLPASLTLGPVLFAFSRSLSSESDY